VQRRLLGAQGGHVAGQALDDITGASVGLVVVARQLARDPVAAPGRDQYW
jgi:hypothetical protein